jgi:Kef-type K+ transport system membrane component KefB
VSFGTLALIGVCALAGPLASALARGALPVVVGEILAGVLIGRSGLHAIDPENATLAFLTEIGFAMLMFSAGMSVPLRDPSLRVALGRGATLAGLVAGFAVGGGLAVSRIGGAGHPGIYAVLIASGSAAIVLPVVQERRLVGGPVLTVIAQVTVADVAATLAVPIVLLPSHAGRELLGAGAVALSVIAILAVGRWLRGKAAVHTLRALGKRRRWAIDLRMALIVLFVLGWITQRTGVSLLFAGFGAGLMVAAIGGPKRLSTEVLGIAGGFFIPLFFVVLGASLDIRGLFDDPTLLGLALALAVLNTAVHLLAAFIMRQPLAGALLATAQLGIPAALVALGLPEHVITPAQGAAILAAALISVATCAVGAARLVPRYQEGRERSGGEDSPAEPSSAGSHCDETLGGAPRAPARPSRALPPADTG